MKVKECGVTRENTYQKEWTLTIRVTDAESTDIASLQTAMHLMVEQENPFAMLQAHMQPAATP